MKSILFALVLFIPITSWAQSQWIKLGEGTARWGLFKLYDATLFAPPERSSENLLSDNTPLKLELCYARRLTVENFVDGANHVLSKQPLTPTLQQAVDQLHLAYRPVEKGDCYILQYQPEEGTRLILNQQTLTTIDTAGFKAVYFGIWLGDQPLSTHLKSSLLENL